MFIRYYGYFASEVSVELQLFQKLIQRKEVGGRDGRGGVRDIGARGMQVGELKKEKGEMKGEGYMKGAEWKNGVDLREVIES